MPIRLTELLKQVPRQTESRVKKTREAMRNIIQELLRSECRLQLKVEQPEGSKDPGVQVPVEITAAYPVSFENIEFPDDHALYLLLSTYRGSLQQTSDGLTGVLELINKLSRTKWADLVAAGSQNARQTAILSDHLLAMLNQQDPLKKILQVDEDILGAYIYEIPALWLDEHPNKAKIQVYWAVHGLIAQWMPAAVEDIAIGTLAHELAHAYTQLGADIDGHRWPAASFAETESAVKEGLAQYYTHRVLERMNQKWPGALRAFQKMLPSQSKPYRAHEPWVEANKPEEVRLAMIEFRRSGETKLKEFEDRLQTAKRSLRGGTTPKNNPPAQQPDLWPPDAKRASSLSKRSP